MITANGHSHHHLSSVVVLVCIWYQGNENRVDRVGLKKNMRAGRFDASHQQQEIHETRKKLGRGSIWGYDLACHVDCRTGYRTAGCRTGFRTAGCRTGCRTAGCRTAGCRTGCRTAGCRTAGCRTVGCRTVGCRTAGCRTAGCRTAGCRTAGLRTAAGCCTAGCRTAGCQTACLVACHAGLAAGSADRHCRSGRLALVRECRIRIQGYLTKSLETEHLTFCPYTAYTKGSKTWHYVASMVVREIQKIHLRRNGAIKVHHDIICHLCSSWYYHAYLPSFTTIYQLHPATNALICGSLKQRNESWPISIHFNRGLYVSPLFVVRQVIVDM